MTGFDINPFFQQPARYDGPARCRICATADASAGHDWCPAAEALVCDACCRRVLLGAVGAYVAAAVGAAPEPPEARCAECERGHRWFAGQVLGAAVLGERAN